MSIVLAAVAGVLLGGAVGVGPPARMTPGPPPAGVEVAGSGIDFPRTPAFDTVWTVRPGDGLELQNFVGEVLVETWERNEVSVRISRGAEVGFEVRRTGRIWRLSPDRRSDGDGFDYALIVPRSMPLDIRGNELHVRISDHEGEVVVSTVEGDIELERVSGTVEARSLDGSIRVDDARGRMDLYSLDDDVRVTGFEGSLRVETTDGDLVLREIDATDLVGSTVDGNIEFGGLVRPDGHYELVTHDGDIDFGVAGMLDAGIRVSVYDGELVSDFPILLSRMESDREMEFTVAEGSAEVRLQTFDGTVRLRRIELRRRR